MNPDMTSSPEMDYEFLTGGMSIHSLRFKNLEDVQIGKDSTRVFLESTREQGPLFIRTPALEASDFPMEELEVLLEFIFNEDDFSSQIPKKF